LCRLESEGLEAFRWVADTLDGDVLNYEVHILKVGLSMIGCEVESKLLALTRLYLSLHWLNPIVSLLV
jgi:hypothetical protein